jgi:molybdenum cofactor cytidylyltransferase
VAAPSPGKTQITALLLAAGASRRFGDTNKLLAQIGGEALVRHTAHAILGSAVGDLIVVTGHERERVEEALTGLDLTPVYADDHAAGLAASLRCGVGAVPPSAAGAAIFLADMPGLSTALIDRLVAAFEAARGQRIVFPQGPDGAQGHPVIWPRAFFKDLMSLTGDHGAKALLAANAGNALPVPVDDDRAFADIDTAADLERWSADE